MLNFITKNFSKPQNILGKVILSLMNKGHEKAENWALSNIDIKEDMYVLDVGCGGGFNLKQIAARLKNGKVFGADYSKDSVEHSKAFNRKAVNEGKMDIVEACVSNLPFEDNKFDLVTAFETIYFWPDLNLDFREINRVLKNGGLFCIFTEVGLDEKNKKWENIIPNMKVYLKSEILDILENTGFGECKHILHENGRWNLFIVTKLNHI